MPEGFVVEMSLWVCGLQRFRNAAHMRARWCWTDHSASCSSAVYLLVVFIQRWKSESAVRSPHLLQTVAVKDNHSNSTCLLCSTFHLFSPSSKLKILVFSYVLGLIQKSLNLCVRDRERRRGLQLQLYCMIYNIDKSLSFTLCMLQLLLNEIKSVLITQKSCFTQP